MAAQFPAALVTTTQLPNNRLDATTTATNHITDHNNAADEMIAVQGELGINPSASHTTVAVAVAALMTRWTPITEAFVNLQATAVGTYSGKYLATLNELATVASPTGESHHYAYIDPADYAVTGYTLKYRVVMSYVQNATTIGSSVVLTGGLYPYTPPTSTTTTWTPAVGTVTAGSTAAAVAGVPGVSGKGRIVSSTFTAPAADAFQLAVAVSGATTAGTTRIHLRLEYSYA